jgi:hypothetical protein
MRAREEVVYLRLTIDHLVELLRDEREERTRLVNALLAKSSGEFALRQKVSIPEPLTDVPREAREAPLQPMGL